MEEKLMQTFNVYVWILGGPKELISSLSISFVVSILFVSKVKEWTGAAVLCAGSAAVSVQLVITPAINNCHQPSAM